MSRYIRTIADYAIEIATDVYDALDVNEQIDFLTTYSNADELIDMVWERMSTEISEGLLKNVIFFELRDKKDDIYRDVVDITTDRYIEKQRAEEN